MPITLRKLNQLVAAGKLVKVVIRCSVDNWSEEDPDSGFFKPMREWLMEQECRILPVLAKSDEIKVVSDFYMFTYTHNNVQRRTLLEFDSVAVFDIQTGVSLAEVAVTYWLGNKDMAILFKLKFGGV